MTRRLRSALIFARTIALGLPPRRPHAGWRLSDESCGDALSTVAGYLVMVITK